MPKIAFSTLKKAAQASFYLKRSLKEKTPQAAGLLNDYLKADNGFFKKFDQIKNPDGQNTNYSPISEETLIPFLKRIWKENPYNIIDGLEKYKAEGSIAHLYFARLKADGREVALKVLKPEIENEIYTLTQILKLLPEVSFLKKWNFPFASYKSEISDRMLSECDFNNEILNNKLAQAIKESSPVDYPFIHLQYSNRHLLCMDRMTGQPLFFLGKDLPESQREDIARKLTQIFFHQILKTGFFQSDWNPGNILYDIESHKIQMIDFGSWIELNTQEQQALLELISCRSVDSHSIKQQLMALGFSESHLLKIEPLLPRIVEILVRPLFHESTIDFNQWNPSAMLNEELGDLKWWFRSAGPAKGIFLIRAFHGYLCHLKALNIPINFMNSYVVESAGPLPSTKDSHKSSLESKQLHIELTDLNNKPIVNLHFPIHTIHNLQELMGDSICEKVRTHQIDIDDLIQNFIRCGGPIGPFLKAETKDRQIRIWTT